MELSTKTREWIKNNEEYIDSLTSNTIPFEEYKHIIPADIRSEVRHVLKEIGIKLAYPVKKQSSFSASKIKEIKNKLSNLDGVVPFENPRRSERKNGDIVFTAEYHFGNPNKFIPRSNTLHQTSAIPNSEVLANMIELDFAFQGGKNIRTYLNNKLHKEFPDAYKIEVPTEGISDYELTIKAKVYFKA